MHNSCNNWKFPGNDPERKYVIRTFMKKSVKSQMEKTIIKTTHTMMTLNILI